MIEYKITPSDEIVSLRKRPCSPVPTLLNIHSLCNDEQRSEYRPLMLQEKELSGS